MKFIIIILSVLSTINCQLSSRAISDILLQQNHSRFDLISYQNGRTTFVDDIFQNVSKDLAEIASITISTKEAMSIDPNNYHHQLQYTSFIVFDNLIRFMFLVTSINWQHFSITTRLIHTVYIRNAAPDHVGKTNFISEFLEMPTYDHWFYFINFVFDYAGVVTLHRIVTFQPNDCRAKRLVEINRFDSKAGKWEGSNFGIRKFTNFNGCPLIVSLEAPFATFVDENGNVRGHAHDVLEFLAKPLNFTIQYVNIPENPEGPQAGIDLQLWIWFGYLLNKPYIFDDLSMYVPLGERYSSYEIFLLPFGWDVWVAVILTLLCGLMTIFVVKLCRYKEFVFGRKVKTPSLYLATAFFGIGQNILPTRNFARYLLMMYILWCLVIRTCYQGEYYRYLLADERKATIETIDEVVERNFTIYTSTSRGSILLNTPFSNSKK